MAIFANKPLICPLSGGQTAHTVNVCFQNGDKTVSLACDDSTGGMPTLARTDIELHRGSGRDLRVCNGEVFGSMDPVPGTMENFEKALNWLRRTDWGLESER